MKMTLAIIAGGKGSRMNYQNKAFLMKDDISFVENIIKEGSFFDEVLVITNNFEPYKDLVKKYDIKLFSDIYKEKGPIGGIYTALFNSEFEKVFCVACDMPNIDENLLKEVGNVKFNEDILVCSINSKIQPLCSIYKKSLIQNIKDNIENEDLKLKNLIFNNFSRIIELINFEFANIQLESIEFKLAKSKDIEEKFVNINTSIEYENFLKKGKNMFTVGIITSSDKGYAGLREDKSGEVIENIVKENGFNVVKKIILPDEKEMLRDEMINMCDNLVVNLILTTGGTGFSKRDITPEATREVIEREASGIVEAIRYFSLKITKRAMLSRAVSGIRKDTLIVNLPGSPKACTEALEFVLDDIKHGIEILLGEAKECARK